MNSSVADLASYGLGGLIFVTMVLPMAVWILKYLLKQIGKLETEIERLRGEAVENRRALERAVDAVAENTRVTSTAVTIMERTRA